MGDDTSAATASAEQRGVSSYGWHVLVPLFLISIVNQMDKTIVPALVEPPKAEFIAGVGYAISYTLFGIPRLLGFCSVTDASLVGRA